MALGDFEAPSAWRQDLDRRWPERAVIKSLVVETLKQVCASERPKLLELGPGDGELLVQLQARYANASFTAADIEPSLLQHLSARVLRPVATVEINLSESWSKLGGPFDAIYSVQMLHDLGGEEALRDAYLKARASLAPGRLLLNADFVEPFVNDDPARPRRIDVETHRRLLWEADFVDSRCVGEVGGMACVCASRGRY